METNLLLNKYIDGELTETELKTFNKLTETEPYFNNQIKTMRFIDNKLKEFIPEQPSTNFTQNVMNKIIVNYSKAADNVFFLLVMVFIGLILVTGIAAFIAGSGSSHLGISVTEKLNSLANEINLNSILSVFRNNNILLIFSVISLLMLISTFFIRQNFQNLKHKIESEF